MIHSNLRRNADLLVLTQRNAERPEDRGRQAAQRRLYSLCLNLSSSMAVQEAQFSVQRGRRTSRSGLSAWRGEGGSPAPPPPPPAAPLPPPTTGSLNESADGAAMFQPCDVTPAHWSNRSAVPLTTLCASSLQLRYLDIIREVKSTTTILRTDADGKIINHSISRSDVGRWTARDVPSTDVQGTPGQCSDRWLRPHEINSSMYSTRGSSPEAFQTAVDRRGITQLRPTQTLCHVLTMNPDPLSFSAPTRAEIDWCFGDSYCLHHQTLLVEAVSTPKTSLNITTLRSANIPHRREDLRSHEKFILYLTLQWALWRQRNTHICSVEIMDWNTRST
jgi:hypothetical protein